MNIYLAAASLLAILLVSTTFGIVVKRLLPASHRDRETIELVQLVNGMMVTFAAIVLGLLTASVKTSFDQTDNNLRTLAVQIVRLDGSLRLYGSDAIPLRDLLRRYTAAAIADTWPDEPLPPGDDYPRHPRRLPSDAPLETSALGDMIHQLDREIRTLRPADDYHRLVLDDCVGRARALVQARWSLIEQAHSSISAPFYDVMVFWLAVIFISFGLSAPRNPLVFATVLLGAVSIASIMFVILDLDTPLTGAINVDSAPMRDALAHLGR